MQNLAEELAPCVFQLRVGSAEDRRKLTLSARLCFDLETELGLPS